MLFLFLLGAMICHCEPFVPKDEKQVLERLRATPANASTRELRKMRSELSAQPTNSILASRFVRHCLEQYRSEGDPRFIGQAQAALAPWWSTEAPTTDLLVLRATLKQSQHDFDGALHDLNHVLRTDPANGQAWLTRVTILAVQGRYAEARASCAPLAQLAPGLVSITAAASVSSLNGSAERASSLLRSAIDQNAKAPVAQRQWAMTILAEMLTRLGRTAEAGACFEDALALSQRDTYLLGAYSDFLLDLGRPDEVAALLADENRSDGLLLRLALAEKKLKPGSSLLSQHIQTLQSRFEENRLRGESAHQREEARFALYLLGDPQKAVKLALSNWQVQHEPADLRILLESALADRDLTAARPGLEFVQQNNLEDVLITKLVHQMNLLANR
jgi:tetratricopeptide (TPR) repeat protein